jgi:hypothetical protein
MGHRQIMIDACEDCAHVNICKWAEKRSAEIDEFNRQLKATLDSLPEYITVKIGSYSLRCRNFDLAKKENTKTHGMCKHSTIYERNPAAKVNCKRHNRDGLSKSARGCCSFVRKGENAEV